MFVKTYLFVFLDKFSIKVENKSFRILAYQFSNFLSLSTFGVPFLNEGF